jgi:CHAP domain/Putative peptidoglycan binding domain
LPLPGILKLGATGISVQTIQQRLAVHGYAPGEQGVYDKATRAAVAAFQAQHVDVRGEPLRADGIVGPATWWALEQQPGDAKILDPNAHTLMPPASAGGTRRGRSALEAAIGELVARRGEQGGNNRGPDVRKYLNDVVPEPSEWCAAFVSWCFHQNVTDAPDNKWPVPYTVGARALLNNVPKGDRYKLNDAKRRPEPGDLICWSRGDPKGWQGHVGIVHSTIGGVVLTIEGNRTSKVAGFSYTLASLKSSVNFLGFGRVKD